MKLVRVVALALALAGCGAPDHQPPPEKPPETAQERLDWSLRQLEKDPKDAGALYTQAHALEELGRIDEAIVAYGRCINAIPRGTLTTPVLDLAKLHHRLGNLDVAERFYRDVLGTFPADTKLYVKNPDYRDSALGLAVVLKEAGLPGAARELDELRRRFLQDFGGDEATWAKGAAWVKEPVAKAQRPKGDVAPIASPTPPR
jgi:tetratricopeptide (TPR) repeat protein